MKINCLLLLSKCAEHNLKIEEVQFYVDTNNSKMLYSVIKAIYGPSRSATAPPLTSADGSTIIKDKEGTRARRKERFNQLLNWPSSVDEEALQLTPKKPLLEDLDLLFSADEVKTTIREMKMRFLQNCAGHSVPQLSMHSTASYCLFWRKSVCQQTFETPP